MIYFVLTNDIFFLMNDIIFLTNDLTNDIFFF